MENRQRDEQSPRRRVRFTPSEESAPADSGAALSPEGSGAGSAPADSGAGSSPEPIEPIDPYWAEVSALVSRAERNRAEMSRLQAERAEICAAALDLVAVRVAQRQAERPGRELGDTIPLREIIAELATALHVGERTVSTWLGDGAALTGTYTATLTALREGRIDDRHASAIVDAGLALRPENRAEYERIVLDYADTETASATRRFARVIAARIQPDIVDDGHRRAHADRRVRAYDLDDGLSRLLLDAPTALVHGIYERLTQMGIAEAETVAEATRPVEAKADAGAAPIDEGEPEGGTSADDADTDTDVDTRTLDQRRADIMCDLLLAGAPAAHADTGLGAIRATVQVTIPVLTLAGLDTEPALLDGTHPIDADTARALAASAPCWQRIMIHPVTHEPLRMDGYRPSARLRRLLAARDPHCRWPGCRRPVRRCDLDHTIPFEDGGPTCAGNLEALCRHHHTLKHAAPWTVVQLGGGRLEFTSPTRRRHRNDAPPVAAARAGRPAWHRLLDAPLEPGHPPPF